MLYEMQLFMNEDGFIVHTKPFNGETCILFKEHLEQPHLFVDLRLTCQFQTSIVIPKTALTILQSFLPSKNIMNSYNSHNFNYMCTLSLIEVKEKADMYLKILLGTIQELEAKEEQIKKLESMKRDPHNETSGMCIFNKSIVTFHLTYYLCRRGRCRNPPFRGQR